MNCTTEGKAEHGAAQLCRRSRQAAECRARRPSRLVLRETDGVTPLADAQRQLRVHRGKRRAARPLALGCGLQLNV
jgi:hypothetical protein